MMISSRKGSTVIFFMVALILTILSKVSWATALVMPRELIELAKANNCMPIDDFFDRPGMVNPPFVYGWLPGDPQDSVVFWCKSGQKSPKPYKLVFKSARREQSLPCPATIDWQNPPGGLSVETRRHLALGDFRHVSNPKRAVPKTSVIDATVIVNYYDGLTDVFYCYRGQWLVKTTE